MTLFKKKRKSMTKKNGKTLRKKSRKTELQKLEDTLWTVFSIYIRSKNADHRGYVRCYTCNKLIHWKYETDAGHYIKRTFKNTKFDERNVRPQCTRCNRYLDGNQDEFAAHLEEEYGKGIVTDLIRSKHIIKQFSVKELKELIDKYKSLCPTI